MANTPLSQKRFLRMFIGSWLVWATVHAFILYRMGVSIQDAWTDSVIMNVLLCGGCILLSNNLQYYLPKRDRYWYIVTFSMVIAAVVWLVVKYTLQWITPADSFYYKVLQQSYPVRYCVSFLVSAFMAVISVLWYTFDEREKQTQRENEMAKLAKEAELYNLRQQLQPHFLFNSLNSINALIGSKPEQARAMVQQLSSFLRSTLKKDEGQWVPLQEELEQLELYLGIEKVRFGNRLQTVVQTDEVTLQMKMPALLLQPLVENAIKFGLYGTVGETVIELHATAADGQLNIAIINPFDHDSTPNEKGTGFGLNSVKRRLYLLFGRHDLVTTTTQGNQFVVNITIPQMV